MENNIEEKFDNIKNNMDKTVELLKEQINTLQKENNELKRREDVTLEFFDENGIKNNEDLMEIINEYHYNLYNNSDTLRVFKEIEDELFYLKIEHYSIFKLYKYWNKRMLIKTRKLKEKILENKSIFNKLDKELSILEKEYEEWCKIPRCCSCNVIFDNNNIPYNVNKYELNKLCNKCISDELNKIIEQKKLIKEIKEEHKESKFINKLYSKNYVYLNYYNELYKNSKEENKLNNLCYRSNKLLELFEDKIKFFNIPESDLARMGTMEFQALCDVLHKLVDECLDCKKYDKGLCKLHFDEIQKNMIDEEPSDFESDMEQDYIPEEEYESDDDAMNFGSSMLSRQGLINNIVF